MAAPNAFPSFVKTGVAPVIRITAANASSDGGGTIATDIFLVLTADTTNGSWVDYVRIIPRASAAATSTSSTVVRLFISTQTSGATTSANTNLIFEVNCPSVTADNTVTSVPYYDLPVNQRITAGQTLLVTAHQGVAGSTSLGAQAFGGDY